MWIWGLELDLGLYPQQGKTGGNRESPQGLRGFVASTAQATPGPGGGSRGGTEGPGLWVELVPAPGLHFKAEVCHSL